MAHDQRRRKYGHVGPIVGEKLFLYEKEKIEARLMLEREIHGDCWLWTGSRLPDGYGVIRVDGKKYPVHRLSLHLYKGFNLESDLVACHTCDNPPCFNPAHLFIGTKADNNRDRNNKGRSAKGESSGTAKLTNDMVVEIREKRARGVPRAILSKEYGVNENSIYNISSRKTWRHIP